MSLMSNTAPIYQYGSTAQSYQKADYPELADVSAIEILEEGDPHDLAVVGSDDVEILNEDIVRGSPRGAPLLEHVGGDSEQSQTVSSTQSSGSSRGRGKGRHKRKKKTKRRKPTPRSWPIALVIVTALNIGGFIFEMSEGDWKFAPFSENPMIGPHPEALIRAGAKLTSKIEDGEWWRLFSPLILHAGLIHLGVNMIAWIKLARDLEPLYTWWRLLIIYVLAGVVGNLASAVFLPGVITVGASGAIFGMLGASWVEFFQNYPRRARGWCCQLWILIIGTVVDLLIGLVPLIDNFAHIGGLIGGILIGQTLIMSTNPPKHLLPYPRPRPPRMSLCRIVLAVVFVVTYLSLFSIAAVLLFEGTFTPNWCPGCQEINCLSAIFDCSYAQ